MHGERKLNAPARKDRKIKTSIPDCGRLGLALNGFESKVAAEEGFEGEKSNAQLHLHPDARAVYASNRGPDSIAMFSIDPRSGVLTSLGQQPAQKVPRAFGIDDDGDFLISGADKSTILTSFRIDANGALKLVEEYDIGTTCAWVVPVKTR